MFCCIVAGRPANVDVQTISPTQYAFNIPSQPSFSHIVVFLLPGYSLSTGTAASVYIQIPPSQDFKLLGAIANDKQSAVFRVRPGSHQIPSSHSIAADDVMVDEATALPASSGQQFSGTNVVLGISIEAIESIRAQLDSLKRQNTETSGTALVLHQPSVQPVTTKLLAQRIIGNAFNFLSSFAGGSSGNEAVPLKAFQDWWKKFEKKIELDPSFLERSEQS